LENDVPTMADVAERAGVSLKTVSRVLNKEDHVRPTVQAKVEAAIEALGYRPNLAARQLAGSRSFIIGYPFNNPSSAYITDVLMGAATACRDRGYHLVSEPVSLGSSGMEAIERLITTVRPDGILLTPPLADVPEVIELVRRLNVPLVRIAGMPADYGQAITIDDHGVSEELVRHLIAEGHRKIGFVRPHPDHAIAQARLTGYRSALVHAGIDVDETLIQPGYFDVDSGISAATALLSLDRPPTAIFAANDDMALGVLQVAHQRNLAIPQQIAIAGFDDSPASRLAWPPLTTVRQPTKLLGETAAAMLLGEKPNPETNKHQLLIRASTRQP
jgi:LacI family transcriptional regulator